MTAPDNFPYDELWYFRGISHGNKNPKDTWGGYTDDDGDPTDFAEAEHVYTHDEVTMFPRQDAWLTMSIQHREDMRRWLLVIDIDIHKAPDDFDENRVKVPQDTAIVRTQSGGIHVYFMVTQRLTRGNERDFEITQDLPGEFDVDIRGEFVKHHVVAPSDIPGVGGPYVLANDERILARSDPDELVKQITMDGDPLLRYKPGGGPTDTGDTINRDKIDPPEEMPKCYANGLELRRTAPEQDNDINTHKVNVLTALCGLAAGYSTDTVVDHFVEDYYPGDPSNADREKTNYQVNHLADKLDNGEYKPPANLSLQGHGILPEGEWCDCGVRSHTGKPRAVNTVSGNEVFQYVETTDDMDMIFDALASIGPGDIEVDVPAGVSEHETYDCWILDDRATNLDAMQLVGYEMDVVDQIGDYPSGDDDEFWRVVAELRHRGANIPRFTGGYGIHADEIGEYDPDGDENNQILEESRT